MIETKYKARRGQIATYFDETAVEAWQKLTSDAPVSRIRETVRSGREQTLNTLLSWLPESLQGYRILDAGCGTGLLAIQLAQRGADVVAIDLSPKLVHLARERHAAALAAAPGKVTFISGDMLNDELGDFDYAVAMDSLIHYEPSDVLAALSQLAPRTRHGINFTFAPRTPMLSMMHKAGKLFPKKDRSPAIVPVSVKHLNKLIDTAPPLANWRAERDCRIDVGFYKTHALELLRR